MKTLKNIISKVLKEESEKKIQSNVISNSSDFYFYKTATGGLLILPKSAKPKILSTIDKSLLKSYYNTTEKILEVATPTVKNTCNTFYKNMDLEECCAIWLQTRYDKYVDGGVHKFEATTPDGNRKTFTGCWKQTNNGKPIPFDQFILSGYFPNTGSDRKCYGNPWSVEMSSSEVEKKEDFGQKINFSLKLQMIK